MSEITKRYISIGTKGCAFAELTEAQITESKIKLNAHNEIARQNRTATQLGLAKSGKHQNSAYYDARGYISASKVWVGDLQVALDAKLIVSATATVLDGKGKEVKVACYARTCYKGSDNFFAVDSELGRIEGRAVRFGEKRKAGIVKNLKFARDIQSIELAK